MIKNKGNNQEEAEAKDNPVWKCMLLMVIGTTALICTVPFESKFIIDTVVAVLCGAILWIGTFRHKELRKTCGVVMLLCYVAYFLYLCLV